MNGKTEAQIRATFKDTKKNQVKWRKKIDTLINENRCVLPDEREDLFTLFDDATYGLGIEPVTFYLRDGWKLEIPNLQYFLRCLIYYNRSNVVDGEFLFSKLGRYKSYSVPINEMWEHVRDACGGVMAEALTMSIRISKEQTQNRRQVKTIQTIK